MLTIDRVAVITVPGKEPVYSPYGHVIAPDGTAYALVYQYHHGVVLALLRPDLLAAFRLREPKSQHDEEGNYLGESDVLVMPDNAEDINVFSFQEFELAHNGQHEFIRFCPTRIGDPSVDLPYSACTPQQVEALRQLLMVTMGMKLRDPVAMSLRDVTVKKCLELASLDKEARYAHL